MDKVIVLAEALQLAVKRCPKSMLDQRLLKIRTISPRQQDERQVYTATCVYQIRWETFLKMLQPWIRAAIEKAGGLSKGKHGFQKVHHHSLRSNSNRGSRERRHVIILPGGSRYLAFCPCKLLLPLPGGATCRSSAEQVQASRKPDVRHEKLFGRPYIYMPRSKVGEAN